VHFIRNVFTPVPSQRSKESGAPLRILVVSAQPEGTLPLSIGNEEDWIRNQFRGLTEAGLVAIKGFTNATPESLHQRILASGIKEAPYDIVHLIGHGDFDTNADQGQLLFVSEEGGTHPVDIQTLREILCGKGGSTDLSQCLRHGSLHGRAARESKNSRPEMRDERRRCAGAGGRRSSRGRGKSI